jgi:hypothetical protein
VSGEIATLVNMGSLALNLLLESSQDKGVELKLEVAALEDQVWLSLVCLCHGLVV